MHSFDSLHVFESMMMCIRRLVHIYRAASSAGPSSCVPFTTSCGTKAESVTLVNKLRSCLMAALEAFKIVQGHGMDITDELDDVRVQLAAEYNGVVRAAHLHAPSKFPDGPYADLVKLKGSCQRAPSVFKDLLDTLPPLQPSESMGGPREHDSQYYIDEDLQAVACFKGDGTEGGAHPFVWDLKYHEQLKDVTIDRTDLRVHLSPDVRARFGLRQWPKSLKKILISELVYHALEGNPVLDGYVVVPYNQTRKDVHVKNLAYVRGEAKNFRPGAIVPERPDVDVGFPFLPRGVTIFVPDINKLDNFEFHVRPATSYLRNDGTRLLLQRRTSRKR